MTLPGAANPDSAFIIKVCGITSTADGQSAVDAGATALGFNFYPGSPRYVTAEQAGRIVKQIVGTYLRVGVFVNATESELLEVLSIAELDVVQLHGTLPQALPVGARVWRAAAADKLPTLDRAFEAYLLDTPSTAFGGSGVSFDWNLVSAFPAPFLVAGGLHSGNVAEAMTLTRAAGVDACSRLESAPGKKDSNLVKAFVRAAATARRQLLTKETIVTI